MVFKKEDIHITGDSVIVKSVTKNDVDDYLYIRRFASIFKEAYDKESGLWEYMKPGLLEDLDGADVICLICLKGSGCAIGYIELEMEDAHYPKVGIGILEGERRKGYAFEASRLFIQKALEDVEIDCVEWMTTNSNEASNRIAQKLGGKIVRKEPIIPLETLENWKRDELSDTMENFYCNVYRIYREGE